MTRQRAYERAEAHPKEVAHYRQARLVEREKAVDAKGSGGGAPEEATRYEETALASQLVIAIVIAIVIATSVRAIVKNIAWYALCALIVIFVYGAIAMGIFSALMLIKRLTSTL